MYHIAGIFQGLNFQGLASFLNFYDLIFEVIHLHVNLSILKWSL